MQHETYALFPLLKEKTRQRVAPARGWMLSLPYALRRLLPYSPDCSSRLDTSINMAASAMVAQPAAANKAVIESER